jgi:hypothetical protein
MFVVFCNVIFFIAKVIRILDKKILKIDNFLLFFEEAGFEDDAAAVDFAVYFFGIVGEAD